jgi:hypothetical protein
MTVDAGNVVVHPHPVEKVANAENLAAAQGVIAKVAHVRPETIGAVRAATTDGMNVAASHNARKHRCRYRK